MGNGKETGHLIKHTATFFFPVSLTAPDKVEKTKKERKIYTSVFTMMLINLCINSITCQVISV